LGSTLRSDKLLYVCGGFLISSCSAGVKSSIFHDAREVALKTYRLKNRVVELMAKRKSPAAVAIELGVPIKTVKKIVQERKRK
jgi:hypothetical protein